VGISGAQAGVGILSGHFADRCLTEKTQKLDAAKSRRPPQRAGADRGCGQADCTVCGDLERVQETAFQAETEVDQGLEFIRRPESGAESAARRMAESAARQIELREVYPVSWAWKNPVVTLNFKVTC
jgi:hypothetical protein